MTREQIALALIQQFEACKLVAYRDGGGVLTIGWGHTAGVTVGQTCTKAQAAAWCVSDMGDVGKVIDAALKTPSLQAAANLFRPKIAQAAALSFGYNAGVGALGRLLTGDLVIVTVEDVPTFQNASGVRYGYVNAKGIADPGLYNRRTLEGTLILASAV